MPRGLDNSEIGMLFDPVHDDLPVPGWGKGKGRVSEPQTARRGWVLGRNGLPGSRGKSGKSSPPNPQPVGVLRKPIAGVVWAVDRPVVPAQVSAGSSAA